MKAYIIGAGGGGSWLVPSMCMLIGKDNVIVIDRDTLEHRNLNRQLFSEDDIGENKAVALARKYDCEARDIFFTFACIDHQRDDWLMCCADNHPCRKAVLKTCDEFGCRAIIAANEKTSAEAYFYRKDWKGTRLDPRTYYTDIETDQSDDPTRPESCTGEDQQRTPQLVSANMMAISLAQWLFVFWAMKRPSLDRSMGEDNFPYHLRSNMTKLETFTIKDANANSH